LILPALLAASVLCSCSPAIGLRVDAGSAALTTELGRMASAYSQSSGVHVRMLDASSSKTGVAVTIGWSFVDDGKTFPISQEKVQAAGFRTALAFERWARGDAGWREVPILWDAWGVATPPGKAGAPSGPETFEWRDRGAFITSRKWFLAPGGESGARQSLFWFSDGELPEDSAVTGILLGGTERALPSGLAYFKLFAAITADPVFSRGSFNLLKPDVENLSRSSGADFLFGNYQWLRRIPRPGGRDFRSLVYPLSHGYAMPVSFLGGRVTGSGRSAERARDFLLWLLSPENQKELSGQSGYLAANFNAANLDLNGSRARDAAIAAARVVLIDPEPVKGSAAQSWDSLLGGILARPADWERVLAERGKR
jgi:hypothetical protein